MKCKYCNNYFLINEIDYTFCCNCNVSFIYVNSEMLYETYELNDDYKFEIDYVSKKCNLILGYNQVIWTENYIPENVNPANIKNKIKTIQTFK